MSDQVKYVTHKVDSLLLTDTSSPLIISLLFFTDVSLLFAAPTSDVFTKTFTTFSIKTPWVCPEQGFVCIDQARR